MKIAIIIPTYSDPKIINAINSVKNADILGLTKIYVINGCVGHQINDLINTHLRPGDVHLIENDLGVFDALNKGLDISSEAIIGWLGSDDLIPPSFDFKRVIAALDENDVVIFDTLHVRGGVTKRRTKARALHDIRKGHNNPHFSTYLNRNVLKGLRFDLSYNNVADIVFFQELFTEELLVLPIPEVGCYMELGGISNAGWKRIAVNNMHVFMYVSTKKGVIRSLQFLVNKLFGKIGL